MLRVNWLVGNAIVDNSHSNAFFFLRHFQCAELAGIPFDDVRDCAYGSDGDKLQLLAERKTQDVAHPNPMLKFVPTIIYNHRFDQAKQNRSLQDFRSVVCDELRAISNVLPQICLTI